MTDPSADSNHMVPKEMAEASGDLLAQVEASVNVETLALNHYRLI